MILDTRLTESAALAQVTIRIIDDSEQPEFDRILEAEHYLHQARIPGRCLRYVAELNGQWLALIVFSPAALHVKARERKVRWSARQRARRLGFVVNNSRLLVRPQRERYPNLASRVLALCLQRLEADWLERWQQPVLVVESFVDESQYRGTCYRACGFEAVGLSKGFARDGRDFYVQHDKPKQLYLRELRPGALRLLARSRLPAELAEAEGCQSGPCPFPAQDLGSLRQRLGQLRDSRRGHGLRHSSLYVLSCATVATLMGACGYRSFETTCKKFTQRQLRALGAAADEDGNFKAPSDSTFLRVIKQIDVAKLAGLVGGWLLEQEPAALARLAVDGKVLRGSGRRDGKPVQLLSAVTHHLCLSLNHIPIAEKTNEIPMFRPLIEVLNLPPGVLLTADAMHCQQEISRFITQQLGGDYLFGLKGNQSGILDRAERLLANQQFSPLE